MKTVKTWSASICVGLREGYAGRCFLVKDVEEICQQYCNEISLGVTVTSTTFIYKSGTEPGVVIGVINYPRFLDTIEDLKEKVNTLAELLLTKLRQERLTVVFPDETILLEADDFTVHLVE